MKKLLVVFLFGIISPIITKSQEPVYSIVRDIKTFDWYLNQAKLWKAEIEKDKKNVDAWHYYYVANRMAKLTSEDGQWETNKKSVLKDLGTIVDEMEKEIPESYEFNMIKFWNGGNNPEFFPYLEKAYKIDPNRPETFDDFLTHYSIKNDKKNIELFCKKWMETGELSSGLMSWNYNMLMSLDENAIIFVSGDNDTYPKWILQNAMKIREDVLVINTSLLFIEEYKKNMISMAGIPEFEKNPEDFLTKEIKKTKNYQLIYNQWQEAIVFHFIEKSSNRPVYFASSAHTRLYEKFEDKLYTEGLAFKYSEQDYDNIAVLRKNIEQRFLLDYILVDFNNDPSKSVVDFSNMNYLMPFTTIFEHYKLSGEERKAEQIKTLALKIASRTNKLKEIKPLFE